MIVVWLAGVGLGMHWLWQYGGTAGPVLETPEYWPQDATVGRASDRPTLLLFAHPRCTCTRATLSELGWLLSRHPGRFLARVLFLKPAGVPSNWEQTDTWETAGSLPGVVRDVDHDGREAERFGAATSGQALLYGSDGRLLFRGGLTGSRGHVGDNLGRARLSAILGGVDVDRPASPVFGCELADTL
jgi:hypothetical protein